MYFVTVLIYLLQKYSERHIDVPDGIADAYKWNHNIVTILFGIRKSSALVNLGYCDKNHRAGGFTCACIGGKDISVCLLLERKSCPIQLLLMTSLSPNYLHESLVSTGYED